MEDRTVLYTLVGVAVLLIAVISYNNTMAKRRRLLTEVAAPLDDLLIKFARHDGNVVGETVALDGEWLILKQAGVFKAVASSHARVIEDEVILSGSIDWDKAIEDGTAWHKRSTKGQDDAITSQLTTSADVKAPALAAMEEE